MECNAFSECMASVWNKFLCSDSCLGTAAAWRQSAELRIWQSESFLISIGQGIHQGTVSWILLGPPKFKTMITVLQTKSKLANSNSHLKFQASAEKLSTLRSSLANFLVNQWPSGQNKSPQAVHKGSSSPSLSPSGIWCSETYHFWT